MWYTIFDRATTNAKLLWDVVKKGGNMKINTSQIVSISEANQNFSRVARMVDASGSIVIFKNNKPKYKIVDLEQNAEIEMTDDEKIDFVAARILKKYHKAFEELAK